MKQLTLILITIITLVSCGKDEPISKDCGLIENPLNFNSESTIIPLNSQNFWVYTDSLWENGNFKSEKSTLLKIETVYDLEGMTALEFTSILPLLTIKGDTLFSTRYTPEQALPNCFELYYPMFFATTDTVQVDNNPSNKFVFRSTIPVTTPTGVYSDNIVFSEEGYFEVIVNEQVGIIKISFYVNEGINKQKRRTLTLKDYTLY